jgi:hypothetical protein
MTVTAPLYARIMGDCWTHVAAPVRRLHTTHSIVRAHGCVRVEHGRSRLARFLARVLRLPPPSAAAETRLLVTARGDREHWERTFNGHCLDTWQIASNAFEMAERFGALELRFRMGASAAGSLLYDQREASFLFGSVRLRIPSPWAPRVQAREDPAGPTRVKVDVRVALPWVGPLIAYDGVVEVEDTRA